MDRPSTHKGGREKNGEEKAEWDENSDSGVKGVWVRSNSHNAESSRPARAP